MSCVLDTCNKQVLGWRIECRLKVEIEQILTGFLAMSISLMQIYIGVKEIFNIVEMDRKMTVGKTHYPISPVNFFWKKTLILCSELNAKTGYKSRMSTIVR